MNDTIPQELNIDDVSDSILGTDIMDRCERADVDPDCLTTENPEDALVDLIDLKSGYLEV